MNLTEFLQPASIIIASVAAFIASVVAIYGINAWRREFRGKRQMELAEEVLALFYQARDVIKYTRTPMTIRGEGRSRNAEQDEEPDQKKERDLAYTLIERYNSTN